MTHQTFAQLRAEFIRQFSALAQHKSRYEVFRDFVTLSAISLNNVMEPDAERKATLESEYMGIGPVQSWRNTSVRWRVGKRHRCFSQCTCVGAGC